MFIRWKNQLARTLPDNHYVGCDVDHGEFGRCREYDEAHSRGLEQDPVYVHGVANDSDDQVVGEADWWSARQ